MPDSVVKLPDEVWKPVVGYEGLYEVSSLGRVRSLPRDTKTGVRGGKVLSLKAKDKDGYSQIGLCREGSVRIRKVHTMVLEAHVGSRPAGTVGCHNDGDNSNNRLENLRWDTHAANSADKDTHGTLRKGETVPTAVVTEVQVREIRAHYAARRYTQRELANMYGIGYRGINSIVHRRTWRHIA